MLGVLGVCTGIQFLNLSAISGQLFHDNSFQDCLRGLELQADQEGDYFPELYAKDDKRGEIFVELSHGLGNRLRGLISAVSVAQRVNRRLSIIWSSDLHMNSSLFDLLHLDGIEVYQKSFLLCAVTSPNFIVYDYVGRPVDEKQRAPVDLGTSSHIYVRTAYRVHGLLEDEYEISLREKAIASIRPQLAVRNIMSEIKLQLWLQHHVTIRDVTAVHVRMENDLAKDVPGILDLDKNDHRRATKRMRETAKKREKCHYKHFIDNIMLRRKLGRSDRLFFVCSDTPSVPAALESALGPSFYSPHLPLHDSCQGPSARSKECVQLALAELLLLSRAYSFLSSSWSSFSEIVDMIGSFEGGSTTGCET